MDIFIVELNEFDINNIKFSKSFKYNNQKKMSIGYNHDLKEHSNLHIITPYFINSILYTKDVKYIKLSFEPLLGEIKQFYNFIHNIEKKIISQIHKYNPEYSLTSIIKNESIDLFDDNADCIKFIYLTLNDNVYNMNSERSSILELKKQWKFKCLINVDSIWIDINKKKFGLNLNLLQLKIHEPIYLQKCLIPDTNYITSEIHSYNNIINTNTIIAKKVHKEDNIKENKIILAKKYVPPNPQQLMSMLNSLKKVL
jgi:hypothetical protein